MKVTGTATLHAPPKRVWDVLQDPSTLLATIPGCQQLETTGESAYRMTLSAGIASIKGTYFGDVRMTDQDEPSGYTLVASGSGGPGTVQATAKVRLADLGDGSTKLDYDADAVVGGMIGGVGQRVLAGVAKKMAGEFFGGVDKVLTGADLPTSAAAGEEPATGPAPGAPAVGQVIRAPLAEVGRAAARGPGLLPLLGAAVFGVLAALAGAALGARLARRG